MISVFQIRHELNKNINGVIHYGNVTDQEINEYEVLGVKKVIWINPNHQKNTSTYMKAAQKAYKSIYSAIKLLNEDKNANEKRFDTYIRENISYLNLDSYDMIKINPIVQEHKQSPEDTLSILEGIGDLFNKHETIKVIYLSNNSNDISSYLLNYGFVLTFISQNNDAYAYMRK